MKRIIAYFVLVVLILNCTYTLNHYTAYTELQPITISERVGEMVDAQEREQFSLFHGVADFKSATFYEIMEGGYKVKIMTADNIYISVNRDSQAVQILQDYIKNYEEIRGSREDFEHRWKIVDYDTLGQPITSHEVRSIRQNSYSCGCTTGLLLVTLLPNFIFSFFAIGGMTIEFFGTSESGLTRPIPAWISFMAINIGTAVIGTKIGNRLDDKNALNAIKKARLPMEIDQD